MFQQIVLRATLNFLGLLAISLIVKGTVLKTLMPE